MGAVVAGDGKGGEGFRDVGTILCCDGTCGTSIWARYVGYVPTDWEDAGQLPSLGGPLVDSK